MRLSDETFMPGVIFANNFIQGLELEIGDSLERRFIYDYELELITFSDGGYVLQNDEKIPVSKGDIIFSRPGQTTKAYMRYSSYIFSFDLIMGTREVKNDYVLMEAKSFQKVHEHELIDHLPRRVHTNQFERYFTQFKEIVDCYTGQSIGKENYLSSMVVRLLYQLNLEVTETINLNHEKSDVINEILLYITNHIGSHLTLELLSKRAHLSPIYFHQLFLEIVGVTLKAYIIEKRMSVSKTYLIHTSMSVKEIGYKVGYKDASYFCYAFKKENGLSPVAYRQQHQLRF